jgi:hypothetical protein
VRFAVHRPGCPVASPRSHSVPRRDIPGRIYVRVIGETAGCASEPRLALARVRVHVPACRAALACIYGAYLFHSSGSFLAHPAHQQAPAGPQDSAVEPGLSADVPPRIPSGPLGRARHVPDLQVLHAYQVEPACKVRAGLLHPVFASVCLAGAQPGDGEPQPPAAIRTPFSAGQLALQSTQPSALRHGQAGDTQQLARGKGRADNDAAVNANSLTITRCGNRLRDGGEGDMPAPGPVHRYPVGLGAWGHGAGPAEPNPARLRYPDLAGLAAEPSHLPELNGDNAEPLVSPSFPPCGPATGPGEKIGYSPSEVPPAVTFQHDLLGRRGEQAVPTHTNTLANTADIYGEVKRRFLPGLKAGVSAPQSR